MHEEAKRGWRDGRNAVLAGRFGGRVVLWWGVAGGWVGLESGVRYDETHVRGVTLCADVVAFGAWLSRDPVAEALARFDGATLCYVTLARGGRMLFLDRLDCLYTWVSVGNLLADPPVSRETLVADTDWDAVRVFDTLTGALAHAAANDLEVL